ncbi:hypothetical protein A3A68_02640 [Candidatus Saccharibacteria bacterium RIFCSPLOWO2_01_FULL_48_13]|nr:MAG: hypothetical protein A2884_01690 [Candidatus Saccharibacteria bacterium RIFCSPHIGHO2_01_FULL_48_12]OGL36060.1 MAG: hypothetical protein A3F38_02235 [Candidatus Saccharibacteria bacterium RIFCSPHIGHO2_12_FULL_48_21]OGL37502.1 MAG: hypothetical protein A3A68_02640 [Candidatus Saccharibacteria bacterium RIFCSPLOWO2_01_FULL_48_13]
MSTQESNIGQAGRALYGDSWEATLYDEAGHLQASKTVFRGLQRTTMIGRTPDGLPMSAEGAIIAEQMRLNQEAAQQVIAKEE